MPARGRAACPRRGLRTPPKSPRRHHRTAPTRSSYRAVPTDCDRPRRTPRSRPAYRPAANPETRGASGARWYDSTTGLFTRPDPMLAQTDQAYVYAGDDPVNETDPSGECTGGPYCAGGGYGGGTSSSQPCSGSNGTATAILTSASSGQWDYTGGRARIAYDFFVQAVHQQPFQSAAIVGNLMQEDLRLDPGTTSNLSGTLGYGIAQWSSQAWDALIAWIPAPPGSTPTFSQELRFIFTEYTNPAYSKWLPYGASALSDFHSAGDVDSATFAFMQDFEEGNVGAPGSSSYDTANPDKRECYAEHVLNAFGNGSPSTSSSCVYPT